MDAGNRRAMDTTSEKDAGAGSQGRNRLRAKLRRQRTPAGRNHPRKRRIRRPRVGSSRTDDGMAHQRMRMADHGGQDRRTGTRRIRTSPRQI